MNSRHSCAQIKSERTFGWRTQPNEEKKPNPENDDISQVCLLYDYNSDSEQSFNAPEMQNFNETVDVELSKG